VNLSPYCIANKIFHVTVQFVASEIRHRRRVTALFVNNQHHIKRRAQDFNTKFVQYLKGYTAKRLTDEFLEKSWTKCGVNKLFKNLRDTGTVRPNRRPGNVKPHSARTEENAKLLLTDKKVFSVNSPDNRQNKVSGRLREHLKQKLSALHASSAVRVCQLMCTAPLETFQMQVLTYNLGYRRPETSDEYPSPVISHWQSCGPAACPLDSGLSH